MPIALILAFAASIGLHAAALFGLDIDLATEPEPLPLVAELRPMPQQPAVQPENKTEKKSGKAPPAGRKAPRREAVTGPVAAVSQSEPVSMPETGGVSALPVEEAELQPPASVPESVQLPPPSRLPSRGLIRYRVDRGDSNFEIGFAHHEWEIADGRYRLISVVETTGLVWLFRPLRIEMESIGQMTENGLRPDVFGVQGDGRRTKEKALFDWEMMKIRVGNRPEQALDPGAQDLLSFYYQMGYLPNIERGGALPVATGKKYGLYRIEALGEEEIEVPAGVLRTLHVRAPGENTTELWLAYDYLLLPVKIRHVDKKGDSLVQVATEIRLGND